MWPSRRRSRPRYRKGDRDKSALRCPYDLSLQAVGALMVKKSETGSDGRMVEKVADNFLAAPSRGTTLISEVVAGAFFGFGGLGGLFTPQAVRIHVPTRRRMIQARTLILFLF